MAVNQIPEGTSHLFINTKNKKSYYKGNLEDGSWEIHNKGLNTWEKVPKLDLVLIPIDVYLQDEVSNTFNVIEDATISITNVTVKQKEVVLDFINPPITPDDYFLIYDLFEKYSNGAPLGFINGVENYSVFYDHKMSKWYLHTSWNTEYLTVYTSNRNTAMKVVDELNTSLLTTI